MKEIFKNNHLKILPPIGNKYDCLGTRSSRLMSKIKTENGLMEIFKKFA
jgi:hypothetical protein